VDKDGYGACRYVGEPTLKAHQLSFKELVGPIPEGLGVCHTCDNPPCVRPDHLFLGTQADNLADMRAKGRQVRGEQHGRRKLNESEVLNVRLLKQQHVPQRQIASIYNISETAVSNIINNKRWKHI